MKIADLSLDERRHILSALHAQKCTGNLAPNAKALHNLPQHTPASPMPPHICRAMTLLLAGKTRDDTAAVADELAASLA